MQILKKKAHQCALFSTKIAGSYGSFSYYFPNTAAICPTTCHQHCNSFSFPIISPPTLQLIFIPFCHQHSSTSSYQYPTNIVTIFHFPLTLQLFFQPFPHQYCSSYSYHFPNNTSAIFQLFSRQLCSVPKA